MGFRSVLVGGVGFAVVGVGAYAITQDPGPPYSSQSTISAPPTPSKTITPRARSSTRPTPIPSFDASASAAPAPALTSKPPPPQAAKFRGPRPPAHKFGTRVIYVSDGDTFGGYLKKRGEIVVRIIGIDTPETKDPRKGRECYGKEASARLAQLIRGKAVTVALQKKGRTFDDYRRWLLDVWTPKGKFVAAAMVRGGFARTLNIWPNNEHAEFLAKLQHRAKKNERGLWGACRTTI